MPNQKLFIADLQDNQVIETVFLVSSTSIRETRNGEPYLCVSLQDRTGSIEARAWDNAEALASRFDGDDFVAVRGRVSSYRDDLQITILDIQRVDEGDLYLGDFLPHSRWKTDQLFSSLIQIVDEELQAEDIRRFLHALFSDDEFAAAYRRAPAAMQNHHAFIGGLVEHSLSMARLALSMGRHYETYYPGLLDVDLVVAGAILHDMGKVEELSSDRSFAYTTAGRLVGHITMGVERIDRVARSLSPPLDTTRLLQLKHLVLSHHGKLEYGSPIEPRMPEALLLHQIDMVDSRMNMCWNAAQSMSGQEEQGPRWTGYDRVLRGDWFIGPVGANGTGSRGSSTDPSEFASPPDSSESAPPKADPNLSLFGEQK